MGPDGTVLRELHGNDYYLVVGGALWRIPSGLPWNGHAVGSEFIVPDGSLQFDHSRARDGTVFREQHAMQIFVTAGGTAFPIPGLPIPGAPEVTGPIMTVPPGSSGARPRSPADGTFLTGVDPAGNMVSGYVVLGGAHSRFRRLSCSI